MSKLPDCTCAECAARRGGDKAAVSAEFPLGLDPGRITNALCAEMDQVIAATRGRPDNVVVHERDRLRDQVEALTKQVAALEARTRHHLVLTCDRCRASLTMGSSLAVADVVLSVAMELGAAEAGWQVGHRTAAALGARVLLVKDRDLCPHCVAALAV